MTHADPAPRVGRRRMLTAVGGVLVLAGLAIVFVVAGDDVPPEPGAASATTSDRLAAVPNADGDRSIDPKQLRFAEPLPADTFAFVDDESLPAPRMPVDSDVFLTTPGGSTTHDDRIDSVSIVAMDGPRLLMRGGVVDRPAELIESEPSGSSAGVGVDGARYVDTDEGAIAIPLDDGWRLIAPDDYFSFGGGGPHIEPDALVGIAAAIGQRSLAELDDLAGFSVFDGTIDGETVGAGFFDHSTVTVVHSPHERPIGAIMVTLLRLPEPPSALELIATAYTLTRGRIESPDVGDVRFVAGSDVSLELISPVDLVMVSAPGAVGAAIDSIDVAPLAELR